MNLQIKDAGAWRNLVSFHPEKRTEVQYAGAFLLRVLNDARIAMRVVDGGVVLGTCRLPDCAWDA
jgi:hypothetical protein